ncbi:MAG TPA: MMPL family transporter [Saprospiraceae bacterium]|nr:MMPL family transporter [Saprospiraceae bacterium]
MEQHNTKPTSPFEKWVISLTTKLIEYKKTVLFLSVLVPIFAGIGFSNLKFITDSKVFFKKDNPQLLAYEKLENLYSDDDNILIAIAPKSGKVFTKETLTAIKELVDSSWQTPYSVRVDAVTNFQYTRADGDDLYVSDLVPDTDTLSDEDINKIKDIALKEPILFNRLINKDASVTGINITCKVDSSETATPEIVNFIRAKTEAWKDKYKDIDVYMSGNLMLSNAFSEAGQKDGQTLIPLVFLVFLVMIFIFSRTVAGSLSAFIILIISIASALGISGLLGINLSASSSNTPIVIATLAIADCIHILVSVLGYMKHGKSKNDAIIESMKVNFIPVIITSVTTIVGFISLNTGDVPPNADFGNISALGMTFALLFALTTFPALLALMPIKVSQINPTTETKKDFYDGLGNFVIKYPNQILVTSLALLLFSGFFTIKNQLNDEFIKYFSPSIAFRTDSDFINQNLTGVYSLEFSIPAAGEGEINSPEYLNYLEKFAEFANSQPEVVHVNSFSEVHKRVNKALHNDEDAFYTIPKDIKEAAQYNLLYELSLPYGLDLSNQVNIGKSETRFSVTLQEVKSQKMIEIATRLEDWLAKNTPSYMHAKASSLPLMFAHIGERQVRSLISGAIISALLITLILMITFRSFKYGFISIVSNVVPAIFGFGIWYFVLGYVNLGMTAVFGMTLGIIVDDTIHFMSKYLRAKKELKLSTDDAVRYSFANVGRAIVATAGILCVGFFILSQSSFMINSYLALITIIILIASVLICLLTLPALLLKFSK